MKNFDKQREVMEKQYENAVYPADTGLDQAAVWTLFEEHRKKCPDESKVETRAALLHLVLSKGRFAPEPDNPFAGKAIGHDLFQQLRVEWAKPAWEQEFQRPFRWWGVKDMPAGYSYQVDLSHLCPDWESVLTLGLPGLRDRAAQGSTPFHRAAAMACDAAIVFCRRLAEARRDPVLEALANRAPQTLCEAFELSYLYHELVELEGEEIRTMGWFDRLYLDFYRNDLRTGRLTRDSAKELLKYYWMAFYAKYQGTRFGKNFCFGPEINELSRLGMETYHEMNLCDPKLSVRVSDVTPDDFIRQVAVNIRDGRTGIVFLNDDPVIRGLIAHGRTPEDAARYIPVGCFEPAVMGREVSSSGAAYLFLHAFVEPALNGQATFEEYLNDYLNKMREGIRGLTENQKHCERIWPQISPAVLLSASFPHCVKSGRDLTEGGVEYNSSGVIISQIGEVADSLAAVRYLVYDQKRLSAEELRRVLADNWAGHEELRQEVRARAPKWGNGDSAVDELAVTIAHAASDELHRTPNARGGRFFASLYGQQVVENGKLAGALPDGRLAGEALSQNIDACIGMDKNGITGLMESAMKLDAAKFPCGMCLDVSLHPSAVSGPAGADVIAALIRTYLAGGGSGLQFNLLDTKVLRDCQSHPEAYPSLQVRVCGWSSRFRDLSRDSQDTFIARAEFLR